MRPRGRDTIRRVKRLLGLALALAVLPTTAGDAAKVDPNAVGPDTHIQLNGRLLVPFGRMTPVGNHPGGAALTPNGRFLWVLDAGRGRNDIQIVDVDPARACKKGKRGNGCR